MNVASAATDGLVGLWEVPEFVGGMGVWGCRDRHEQPSAGSASWVSNAREVRSSSGPERQQPIVEKAGSPQQLATWTALLRGGDKHGSTPTTADNDAPAIAAKAIRRHRGP